ncbi:MAG: hypothetical protein M1827_005485 [Pycnora praestabilis]|nr:MAG: hypothetical protein M1827_005485 [Pycnora praestabilis]
MVRICSLLHYVTWAVNKLNPTPLDRRVPGYIEGYVRRFWQVCQKVKQCNEHELRPTPSAGKHAKAEHKVWGVAYRIAPSKVEEVKAYLDIREINGYSIQYTPIHPADTSKPDINCLVYIGLPDNPQFMGAQDPQNLAEHIYKSEGPSGENKEYLFMLERALDELSKESGDEHVKDLAESVRKIEQQKRGDHRAINSSESVEDGAVDRELTKVGSTDYQEELEKHEQ